MLKRVVSSWCTVDVCVNVLCIAVGAIFILAGSSKIWRIYDFLDTVYQYRLVSPRLGLAIAVFLPPVEIVTGCCLLTRSLLTPALAAAAGMLAIFVAAQSWVMSQEILVNCGCFGGNLLEAVGWKSLLRTAALLVCVLFAWWSRRWIICRAVSAHFGSGQPAAPSVAANVVPQGGPI